MLEIEAKIKVEDIASYIPLLKKAGAKLVMQLLQKDSFFDSPARELLQNDSGLRLRKETNLQNNTTRIILCHKGPARVGKYKQRQETELEVSNFGIACQLLQNLGFEAVATVEKHREQWQLGGCWVCLDRVAKLGDFVEVEGPSEEAIATVLGQLDLADREHIQESYVKMLVDIATLTHRTHTAP